MGAGIGEWRERVVLELWGFARFCWGCDRGSLNFWGDGNFRGSFWLGIRCNFWCCFWLGICGNFWGSFRLSICGNFWGSFRLSICGNFRGGGSFRLSVGGNFWGCGCFWLSFWSCSDDIRIISKVVVLSGFGCVCCNCRLFGLGDGFLGLQILDELVFGYAGDDEQSRRRDDQGNKKTDRFFGFFFEPDDERYAAEQDSHDCYELENRHRYLRTSRPKKPVTI